MTACDRLSRVAIAMMATIFTRDAGAPTAEKPRDDTPLPADQHRFRPTEPELGRRLGVYLGELQREPQALRSLHRLADADTHVVGVHHRCERDLSVEGVKERFRRRWNLT
jgi:hypothetical protein